jgi:hypothetical protein
MKADKCPNCGKYAFKPFIDPEIGSYMRCSFCHFVITEASMDESD